LTRIGRPDADPLWDLVRARTQADGYTHDEDALGPLAVLRAELAERAAFEGFEREEWPQARAAMLTAAGLYDEAGLAGRAAAARARAATAVVASAEDDPTADLTEPLAELTAQLAAAEELLAEERIEPDRYLAVLQCDAMVARHRLIAELPDAGEEVRTAFEAAADRLLTEAGRLGSPQRASAARQYAGDVAARSGDFTRATAELGAALELVEEADQPWRAPRPLALLAQIELFRGRPEEAVALCHRALAAAARWPDRSLALAPFHALLGHASAAAGDTAAAVRHLSEAADRFDRSPARDSAGQAAQVRLELADMLGAQDRTADAVAVLESVVLGDTSGLDPRLVAQIRLNLGRGLAALGEHRAAAEEFIGLADTVAAWTDEQVTHTLVASEAAVALAEAGQWEAAAAAYARAVASHRRAPRPGAVLQMMRTFARLTMAAREAEGLDAALGHLAEADALLAEVPADSPDIARWYQVGATHYQRSRAYADAASYSEALAEIERAVAAYESGGTPGEEPRAEAVRIAALIEANGLHDPAAATARLTETIARCEAAQLPAAAQTLTALRARLQANAKKSAQGG
jgi:tetratricopeptide (TPR) repeat protein